MQNVKIYIDGCCVGNPGPGGYGCIFLCNGRRRELSQGFRHTTNNRMELTAAVKALETLEESSNVQIFSDSKLLVDAMSLGWIQKWEKQQWAGRTNADLWQNLLAACAPHIVNFTWIKGHSGIMENEVCDVMAKVAARGPVEHLTIDVGYAGSQKEYTNPKQLKLFPGSVNVKKSFYENTC